MMSDEMFSSLTLDNPEVRLDEHDRACLFCAKNEEGCERRKALIEAKLRSTWAREALYEAQ